MTEGTPAQGCRRFFLRKGTEGIKNRQSVHSTPESDYYLRCEECGESMLLLNESEIKSAKELNRLSQEFINGQRSRLDLDIAVRESGLDDRVKLLARNGKATYSHSPWNSFNDEFCEAIKLSNYRPQEAIDKMLQLLDDININAVNEQGRTLLSIAKYYEVPRAVQDLIIKYGGK